MSRRKPLAVLAAVTAAVAVAVPTASASAATTQPSPVAFTPPIEVCQMLSQQTASGLAAGDPLLASLLTTSAVDLGCGGAAL